MFVCICTQEQLRRSIGHIWCFIYLVAICSESDVYSLHRYIRMWIKPQKLRICHMCVVTHVRLRNEYTTKHLYLCIKRAPHAHADGNGRKFDFNTIISNLRLKVAAMLWWVVARGGAACHNCLHTKFLHVILVTYLLNVTAASLSV